MAAQSLEVLIAIIPHLKSYIQKNLTSRQQVLLGEYDRMIKDYTEHQGELYGRLVRLMEDRLLIHIPQFAVSDAVMTIEIG